MKNTMNYQNQDERRTNPRGGLGAVNGYALAGLALGLTLGNFGYQLCAQQHWADAGERTWFQIVALFSVWVFGRLAGPRHNVPVSDGGPAAHDLK